MLGCPRLLIKWCLIKTVYDDSFYAIESFVLHETLYNGNSSSEAGLFSIQTRGEMPPSFQSCPPM